MSDQAPEKCPLSVGVEDSQLVIRIGIGTLAFATECCPLLAGDAIDPPYVKVADKKMLAEDVLRALSDEEEDGTTPVHRLLDEAILEAYAQGSLAFDEPQA